MTTNLPRSAAVYTLAYKRLHRLESDLPDARASLERDEQNLKDAQKAVLRMEMEIAELQAWIAANPDSEDALRAGSQACAGKGLV